MLEPLIEQGNECLKQKKQQQALLYFNSVVLLDPKHIESLINCAQILIGINRPAEALIYSQQALQLKPNCNILTLHATALYQMGNYNEALDCFKCVLVEEPNNYIAMGQLALCLTQVNRYEEALLVYQQALKGSNQDPWICYNFSLCLLAMGNLSLGFALFEYRWLGPLLGKGCEWIMPNSMAMLQGKSILIHSEQGLGDSIQFFRYIPLLVELGAKVVLEIQPALIPLFNSWSNTIRLIAKGSPLPSCDYHCAMMSLAKLFNTEIETIPQFIPYVFPDLPTFEASKQKLGHANYKRIGIAWKGSDHNSMNQKRSLALSTLLTLQQSNLTFICLQKEVSWEEKTELDNYQIPYHSFELSTMVGTAALIACLDLVITVDTSIAHLAAAMGKEVWILLPFSSDWRWFLQREDSPWYPHVTLFRQEGLGDWSFPLARIKKALISFQKETPNDQNILIKNPGCHSASLDIALQSLSQNNMAQAILFMQRACEIAPEVILYKRNLGELLCRVGQLEAAIAVHKVAINLDPEGAENHFLLALAYNNNHQFELAIKHYRIALSFEKNYGLAWNNLGASLESIGNKQQAKQAYETAISLNSNHAEAHNNLGAIYSEEGKIEKARLHFENAITANPDFVEAHYNLSQVKTYVLNDPHLAFLESLNQKIENHPVFARIQYYFAKAKALDNTQQYALAFQAYAHGNQLHYQQNSWDKTQLEDYVEQIPKVFTQSFLKKPKQTQERRTPIFIVGMPRSGTTLIEQILSSHKEIYGAGELSHLDDVIQNACLTSGQSFNTWVMQLSSHDLIELGEKYLDKTWKLAEDKDFIIDKMPGNCFYIGMIYRMFPTAKIIHAVRDPMDSCFSCFTHLFKNGMYFTYDLTALGHYYQLYAKAMQYWHSVLPKNVLFELPYEQMVANHEDLSKQLIAFIGLSWDPNCLNFYNNERLVKTASFTQVRKPIYKTSVARWQHFAKELQPLLEMVTPYRE